MSLYLYGIVRHDAPTRKAARGLELGPGVGEPGAEVGLLAEGAVAAVVSEVPAGGEPREIAAGVNLCAARRDMLAHSQVLNRVVAAGWTVLPVRFGVWADDATDLVHQLLRPQQSTLLEWLDRLDGAIEVGLKATYDEEAVLKEIAASFHGPSRSSGQRSTTYAGRIDLGKRVAGAIEALGQQDRALLLEKLDPLVRDGRMADRPGQSHLMVLRASFLLERGKLETFDRVVEDIQSQVGGRMRIECVGPLPPYSFVDPQLGAPNRQLSGGKRRGVRRGPSAGRASG